MPLTFEALLKELQSGHRRPAYLLSGDEPYYPEQIADLLEAQVVAAPARDFNQFILYGKDLSVAALLGYARRFPMLSEFQLVLVRQAQELPDLQQAATQQLLEQYLAQPLASTVLVLQYQGLPDERRGWVKAFDKYGGWLSSRKIYDSKLPDFVLDYCHRRGVKISRDAVAMLCDFVGNDLKRLTAELDKMLLNLPAESGIQAETVGRFVGLSRQFNNFELQKALARRQAPEAFRIAAHFAANPREHPLPATLVVLYNFFSRLLVVHAADDRSEKALAATLGVNPYFVRDYLNAARLFSPTQVAGLLRGLRQADARLKGLGGGSVSEGDLLRQLLYESLQGS